MNDAPGEREVAVDAELDRLRNRRAADRGSESRAGSPVEEHEDLLSAVLATSVAAICVLDAEGQIVYANEAARSILGLGPSKIVQRRYDAPEWKATSIGGGEWPDEEQPFVRVMTTGEAVHDVRLAIEWPDGQRKMLSVNAAPIKGSDGAVTRVVCSVNDITAELRSAELVEERDEWLKLALFSAQMGIWSWDLQTDMVRWSDEVFALFGFAPGESEVSFGAYVASVHPEDRESVDEAIAEVRDAGADRYFVTHRIVRPSGEIRWLEGRGRVQRDDDGSILTMTGTVVDITARREAEEALQRSQEQLRQAQRLESIGRLAGGVAHDFNNLLTVVHSCAELIAETHGADSGCRELTDSIVAAAEQGAALTRQLLAFAREQKFEPRVVDLNEQVRDSSALLRRLLGVGVELRLSLDVRAVSVEIDPRQFDQVLLNLVVNARDAMQDHGVLSIATGIERSGEPASDRAIVTVEDSGAGIDPDLIPFLFEPFFTTKPPGEGTGLGLSTCFGIIAQANGTIAAESEVGRGARFRIELPLVDRSRLVDSAATSPDLPIVEGRGTVLLVEDNRMVRRVVRTILERAGYEVLEAADAGTAIEAFAAMRERVEVLVTDIAMPKSSGQDLVRALWAVDPDLRVLFISGTAIEIADIAPEHRDRVGVLPKPFSVWELTDEVAKLRGSRR